MSDDKLKISWDDLSPSQSRPEVPPYSIGSDRGPSQAPYSVPPAASAPSKDNTPLLILGIIGAVFALCILYFVCKGSMEGGKPPLHRQTVDEWCANTRESLNLEFAKPDTPVRKRIENAHLTVKVSHVNVVSLTAQTLDGTNYSKDGANIASVETNIKFTWDGIFQKGGYSILHIIYDMQNGKLISSEISETNALFNTEDPEFWYNVGFGVGTLLAL